VLSGYRCDLYDTLFSDWERRETNAYADGRRPRIECVWLNPSVANKQSQTRLFA
jgi:DNA adenine methylase